MIQIYFLSILLNFTAGVVLSAGLLEKRFSLAEGLEETVKEKSSFVLVLGILTILVGVLKFLSVVEGDVKVVGDFFPAVIGIGAGLSLLSSYYRGRTDVLPAETSGFNSFLEKYQVIIGLAAVAVALLHFFIPRVLFL
jgi:hypothetical protein